MPNYKTSDILKDLVSDQDSIDFHKYLSQYKTEDLINEIEKKKGVIPFKKDITITNEPIVEENFSKLPESIKKELTNIYKKMDSVNNKTIIQLKNLKNMYPKVPIIYNYLGNVYFMLNMKEKQLGIIKEIRLKFPNYLFGKMSLAEYYIHNNEMEKIPEALENKLEIYQHFPESKKVFHSSEVIAFYALVCEYYLYTKMNEQALLCYLLLVQIGESHPATSSIARKLFMVLNKNGVGKEGDN